MSGSQGSNGIIRNNLVTFLEYTRYSIIVPTLKRIVRYMIIFDKFKGPKLFENIFERLF